MADLELINQMFNFVLNLTSQNQMVQRQWVYWVSYHSSRLSAPLRDLLI